MVDTSEFGVDTKGPAVTSRLGWAGWAGISSIIAAAALVVSILAWQIPNSRMPSSSTPPPVVSSGPPNVVAPSSEQYPPTSSVDALPSTLRPGRSATPLSGSNDNLNPLELPQSMVGSWRGIVTEGSKKYPTEVVLEGGAAGSVVGRSEYLTLDCLGELTLLSGGYDVILREQNNCLDVELHLELLDATTMSYAAYRGSSTIAEATLTR